MRRYAATRRNAGRRPHPLPAGPVRQPRAAALRRARRAAREPGRRSGARHRAAVGRRAERRQGVGRLRPEAGARLGRALCARADVVLEGFRPGVAERLGIGPAALPESVVYCSLTGFGAEGPHAARAGHDLNYMGYAGVLADTAPAVPPVQIADLGGGRARRGRARSSPRCSSVERTGRGRHLVVSMTHGAHRLAAHRLGGEPSPRLLTGGLARYRIYETADGGSSRSQRSSRSSSAASASCSACRRSTTRRVRRADQVEAAGRMARALRRRGRRRRAGGDARRGRRRIRVRAAAGRCAVAR